jgi:hypothetical protein
LEMLGELRNEVGSYHPSIDGHRAQLLALIGRNAEAHDLRRQVLAAYRDRGMLMSAASFGQAAWQIEMACGDIDAAVAVAFQGCAYLEEVGERFFMSTLAALLAESLYVLGRDDEAANWAARALGLGDPDDAVTQALARMVCALIAARRGEDGNARHDLSVALRTTADMQFPMCQGRVAMNAATVLSSLGDGQAGRHQLERALEHFTAKGATVYIARAADALATTNH